MPVRAIPVPGSLLGGGMRHAQGVARELAGQARHLIDEVAAASGRRITCRTGTLAHRRTGGVTTVR